LDWYDIVDRSEKIGKMYMAAEITQIESNELTETHNDVNVSLLKHVLPKLRTYQLVLFYKNQITNKMYWSTYFVTD